MQRRIAIAQTTMHWTMPDNVASMRLAMSLAQSRGAQLCGFSELAVTGFHRHITREATPQVVLPQRRGRGAGAALLAALVAHAAKVGPTRLYCGTRTAGSLMLACPLKCSGRKSPSKVMLR